VHARHITAADRASRVCAQQRPRRCCARTRVPSRRPRTSLVAESSRISHRQIAPEPVSGYSDDGVCLSPSSADLNPRMLSVAGFDFFPSVSDRLASHLTLLLWSAFSCGATSGLGVGSDNSWQVRRSRADICVGVDFYAAAACQFNKHQLCDIVAQQAKRAVSSGTTRCTTWRTPQEAPSSRESMR